MSPDIDHVLVPHVGWVDYEPGDDVALFLRQGWFESEEQAFLWLYLRGGDVVVDCGAHAGLFSVLGGRLVGDGGRVVSIEPSPRTAGLLRGNLAAHGLSGRSTVLQCAAGAAGGEVVFQQEGAGKSAYNHVGQREGAADRGGGALVAVRSLDDMLAEAGVGRADFAKVDVEGAELDVWAGAAGLVARGALPVVMVEFTERNLRRTGRTTGELYRTIESSGYALCRLDTVALELRPRPLDGPIWYENLFAVRDVEGVNRRLRSADPERVRVARDVIRRGEAGSASRLADERGRRIDELQTYCKELEGDRSRLDAEHAATNAESARQLAEAMARVEALVSRAEAAERTMRERGAEIDAARVRHAAEAARLNQKLDAAREEARQAGRRLHSFCVSRYERISWALHLRAKPPWVDDVVAAHGTAGQSGAGEIPAGATRRPRAEGTAE